MRIWKDAFSVTVFTGYMWTHTLGQSVEKNLRFQRNTGTYRLGLKETTFFFCTLIVFKLTLFSHISDAEVLTHKGLKSI